MKKGYISEIFSSLQGEGIYQGVRQIFIRFSGCNLNCEYCDTPESRVKSVKCKVKGENQEITNPISVENLVSVLSNHFPPPASYSPERVHSVSLTGGEPLLQVNFLEKLLPALKKLGLKIYLETNGTLPKALEKIVDLIDYIAMDIKLPSATGKDLFSEHSDFLQISKKRLQVTSYPPAGAKRRTGRLQVKIVLTNKTLEKEIEKSINLIKKIDKKIPLVLQPVTSVNGIIPPERKKILSWCNLAKKNLSDVQIIPQKHKLWGIK